MASIQHAYRRGAVYWWRRRISLGAGGYLALYISLRTRRPAEARRRANALTVVSDEIKTHILDVTEAILSSEARKRIFQTALQRQLDRIITDQVDTPQEAEAHRRLNAFFAALYRLWAARGTAAVPEDADFDLLRGDGWSDQDVQAFALFARSTPAASVISTVKTQGIARRAGRRGDRADRPAGSSNHLRGTCPGLCRGVRPARAAAAICRRLGTGDPRRLWSIYAGGTANPEWSHGVAAGVVIARAGAGEPRAAMLNPFGGAGGMAIDLGGQTPGPTDAETICAIGGAARPAGGRHLRR